MSGKKKKKKEIDTSIPPHLRPRRDYWPKDVYCRSYYSSVIPKFWVVDNSYENKISGAAKYLLRKNERLLQEQYHEVSPVFSETMLDKRRAECDAKMDIRDFNKQEKLDRRGAAIQAGACDPGYKGTCKDDCRGKGTGGECFRCSGQVLKLDDVTMPILHCELLN